MDVRRALGRSGGGDTLAQVVVKTYGRDSLLVWANLLLAPLFSMLGLRLGIQAKERISARIAADTAQMRRKGYLVSSLETISLPGIVRPDAAATWYRVTFELGATQPQDGAEEQSPA